MTVVAITGINSYFAKSVLPKLQQDPEIKKIIGIDINPWTSDYKKVTFFQEDIRSDNLADLLDGVDTVLHLAFIVEEIHDKKKTHDINIGGSRNVFEACAAANVKKIIYTSSVAAYGSHPDNPIGITEDHPLVENRDSYYSTDKVAVEKYLRDFSEQHSEIDVIILRPPIIIGPKVTNFVRENWSKKTALSSKRRAPEIQFLHEEDLGNALYLAVKEKIKGIFNIASDDYSSTQRLCEIADRKVIALSPMLLKFLMNILFFLRLQKASQGWISLVEYPIILNNKKFKEATDWQPKYTTEEAFRDFYRTVKVFQS